MRLAKRFFFQFMLNSYFIFISSQYTVIFFTLQSLSFSNQVTFLYDVFFTFLFFLLTYPNYFLMVAGNKTIGFLVFFAFVIFLGLHLLYILKDVTGVDWVCSFKCRIAGWFHGRKAISIQYFYDPH